MLKRSIIIGAVCYAFIIFGTAFYLYPSNVLWFVFALSVLGPIGFYPNRIKCDKWSDSELMSYVETHKLLSGGSFVFLQSEAGLSDLRKIVQYHLDITINN